MSGRTTAEIVGDLRSIQSRMHVAAWKQPLTQAADRLAELDALWRMANYPDRPPCPTCGGKGMVPRNFSDTPCTDCVDGKVSIEQLVATYNAVHDPTLHTDDTDWQSCMDELRSVKP